MGGRYRLDEFTWGGTWFAVFDTYQQRQVHWPATEMAGREWIIQMEAANGCG